MLEFKVTVEDMCSFLDEWDLCEDYTVDKNEEEWSISFFLKIKYDDNPILVISNYLNMGGISFIISSPHSCYDGTHIYEVINEHNNTLGLLSGCHFMNQDNSLMLYFFSFTKFGISLDTIKFQLTWFIYAFQEIYQKLERGR